MSEQVWSIQFLDFITNLTLTWNWNCTWWQVVSYSNLFYFDKLSKWLIISMPSQIHIEIYLPRGVLWLYDCRSYYVKKCQVLVWKWSKYFGILLERYFKIWFGYNSYLGINFKHGIMSWHILAVRILRCLIACHIFPFPCSKELFHLW